MVCLFGEQFDLDAVALPTADRDVSGNGGGFRTGIQESGGSSRGTFPLSRRCKAKVWNFPLLSQLMLPSPRGGRRSYTLPCDRTHGTLPNASGGSTARQPPWESYLRCPWLLAEGNPPGPPPEKVAALAEPVARQLGSLPHRKGQRKAIVRGRNHTGGNVSSCDNGEASLTL